MDSDSRDTEMNSSRANKMRHNVIHVVIARSDAAIYYTFWQSTIYSYS